MADIKPFELRNTQEAGVYLGSPENPVPPATLQWWRWKKTGPRYLKIGRRVYYRTSDLDAFIERGVVEVEAAHA